MFNNSHFSDISVQVPAAFSFIFISIGSVAGYEAVQIWADLQSVLAHIAWVITSSFIAAVKAQRTSHQNVSQHAQVLTTAEYSQKQKELVIIKFNQLVNQEQLPQNNFEYILNWLNFQDTELFN